MNLYLDDVRLPPDGKVLVRNYTEFKEFITKNGLPESISLDYDLGSIIDEDSEFQVSNGEISLLSLKGYDDSAPTGEDCLNWLIDYCRRNKKDLPIIYVHSQNPVGRERLKHIISSYLKLKHMSKDKTFIFTDKNSSAVITISALTEVDAWEILDDIVKDITWFRISEELDEN